MRRLPQFISTAEQTALLVLFRRYQVQGWEVRRGPEGEKKRAYGFIPCLEGPGSMVWDLITRSLAALPTRKDLEYWDSFFLYYENGDMTPPHVDSRSGVRINVCISAPDRGGEFVVRSKTIRLEERDAVRFRPAVERHSVSEVVGQRIIWSIGRTRDPFCGGNEKCHM